MAKDRISLCMIAKNEARWIGKALDSVRAIVDEMIVVDTGSTDLTAEIAASKGAKVFNHPWENNFSKARNQSLAYATGNWILILDADEELCQEDIHLIRPLLKNDDILGYNFLNLQMVDYGGQVASQHYNVRLFRANRGIHYEGLVHNQLIIDHDRVKATNIRLFHYGYIKGLDIVEKKYERSIALMKEQLKLTPQAYAYHFHLGCLYYRKKEYSKALEELQKVFGNVDNCKYVAQAYMVMGNCYRNMQDRERAIEYYRKSLEVMPDFVIPRYLMSLLLLEAGNIDRAAEEFTYIINQSDHVKVDGYYDLNHHPGIEEFYAPLGLIRCLAARGDRDRVAEMVKTIKAKTVDQKKELYALLGDYHFQTGDFRRARDYFDRYLEFEPENAGIMFRKAMSWIREGEVERGIGILLEVAKIKPDYSDCWLNLGALEKERGRTDRAIEYFSKVLEYEPENVDALYNIILTLEQAGDIEEADRRFRALIEKEPTSLKRRLKYSEFLARNRRYREAVEMLKNILAAEPDNRPAFELLMNIKKELLKK